MTLLDAPPAPAAPPPAPSGRPRYGRRVLVALAVAVLVAGGIVGGIAIKDAVALSQVHVFLDAKPLTCTDSADITTVQEGDQGDASYLVPAVKGDHALDCTLAVVVDNTSDSDIEVPRITLTDLGPGSEAGLASDRSLTQGLPPERTNGDDLDVVYAYGDRAPIAAGTSERFAFHLVSSGCRQAGASTTFLDSPIVTISTGLVTVDQHRQGVGFALIGEKTSVQPCL